LLAGTIIDSIFYGNFVITPLRYFQVNIIEDAASGFGTSPWYYYIQKILVYPGHIIGILLFISIFLVLTFKPGNLFVWCIILFVAGHSIIPHKEERFLFPIVYLLPVVLTMAYERIRYLISNNNFFKSFAIITLFLMMITNIAGLSVMMFKAAGIGRMAITKYIHDNSKDKVVSLVYLSWANPFDPWHGLQARFYIKENMFQKHIDNLYELDNTLIMNNADNYLVLRKQDYIKDTANIILNNNYILVKQSVPVYAEKLNLLYGGLKTQDILLLFKNKSLYLDTY